MSHQCELFKSLVRLLSADGWTGQAPPTRNYYKWGGTLCELCSIRTRGGTRDQTNQELDPDEVAVFYIRVLCVSCRGEHILSLFHAPPPNPPLPLLLPVLSATGGVGLGGGRV